MTNGATGPLAKRLARDRPLLLDAAMGTEIDRRGLPTTLPLWSALGLIQRPELVRAIHVDNLRAGAEVITTDTFRTTARTLRRAGRDPAEAAGLDRLAVRLAAAARTEAGRADALIAGSIAPLEDCYSPRLTPPLAVALAEHRQQAASLAAAGVDFLMVETMPTAGEAEAALLAAKESGLEATVGFVCAAPAAPDAPHAPEAILVNCAAPSVITAALAELRGLTDRPFGGYANIGTVDDTTGWAADTSISGVAYAAVASEWLRLGARLIGGCCGTTPEHVAALRALIDRVDAAEIPLARNESRGKQ
jgi:S-methylmethionine-dependent homocysteine/selenocysteine methylase